MLLEEHLEGPYFKFNNSGFALKPQQVMRDLARGNKWAAAARPGQPRNDVMREHVRANLLAQAFSHFTYKNSGREEMVVDIQGCALRWTDPCLHSANVQFGHMDHGHRGMRNFFRTHKCNFWCHYLKLQHTMPTASAPGDSD